MIRYCSLFLLLTSFWLHAAEDLVFWHDPAAAFRIRVLQEASDVPAVLDDRHLCLPVPLKNNVRAYDADGNLKPAHYFASGAVFLPPVKKAQELYLYFGYTKKMPNPSFYGLESNSRLAIFQSAHMQVYHTKEWRSFMVRTRRERFNNYVKYLRFNRCTNKKCGHISNTVRRCRNAMFPFCGRNIMFRQNEKSLLWAKDPLLPYRITCCRGILLRPDFALMPGNHNLCHFNRLSSYFNRFTGERKKMREDIKKYRATPPAQGMEESLLNISALTMQRGVLDSGQIYMTRRPTDTGLRSLLYFRGKLYVPATGNYTFRVSTNATHLLSIDGKCVIRRFAEDMPKQGATYTDHTMKLEKGLHEFLLCYHKQKVGTMIYAAWKRENAPVFEILSEENFSPGLPVIPLAIESQSGLRYPVVKFQDKFMFYTSKLGRKVVRLFDGDSRYLFEGKEYPSTSNLFLTEPEIPGFTLLPSDPAFAPMKIAPHPRKTERISLPVSLDLHLHLPDFIYDDEKLNGTWEIRHRLPFPVKPVLTRLPEGQSAEIDLPAHHSGGIDRFSPDFLLKKDFPLWNTGFRDFQYQLALPGMTFKTLGVRYLRPGTKEAFTYHYGNFYAANGDKIIFVLHRPQLHELRKWSLPRQLAGGLKKTQKLCIIGDLEEKVKDTLQTTFRNAGIELKLIPIRPGAESEGSPLPESLCSISQSLEKEKPDTVLIIPPALSRARNHSMRSELRCIAFLLEQARNMDSVRRIMLTTPIPDGADMQNDYAVQLRSLKRDYGVFCLELTAYLANAEPAQFDRKITEFLLKEM